MKTFLDLEGLKLFSAKKANLKSPVFTGTPQAPTVTNTADSSDKIATTAFVHNFIDSTKLQDNIKTLIGNDVNKSARAIANEELTKQLIPDNAQEALDTLQEIAEWIQNHPNDVATINKNIQNLKALIGTIPESSKADNIVDYVQECVNSLRDEFYSYLTTITQSGKTLTITGPNVKEENKTLNIKGRII